MTDQDLMIKLLQQLDAGTARQHRLDSYYEGNAPLSFLSPEARKNLGNRLDRLSIGIGRLVVDSIAERLRVTGFTDPQVWADWLGNDLDQQAPLLHREALTLGHGYVIVWGQGNRPVVTVESARQVATLHDPATRDVIAAVKRWETDKTTEVVIYEPDQISHYRADSKGAAAGFVLVETIANPLGQVPVVRFRNATRILGDGESEMTPVLSLVDAVTKLNVDLMVGSEFGARPRRWATGLELGDDDQAAGTSPIPDNDRMLINEDPSGKFGQLPGSDLTGYTDAIGQLYRQISAVSGLPDHMLGIGGDNPTSADAIRASEAALTAKAEARQAVFGRQWEQVAKLMTAIRTGVDPASVDVSVTWADPSTRSVAQEADAVVKLFTAGLLPQRAALQRLGYTDTQIQEMTA